MTSEQLVESVVDQPEDYTVSDNQYWENLLNDPEHQLRVEKIARKNTRGTVVSWEDAAQTAHTKLLEAVKAHKFRHGKAEQFYAWAARVARYAVIDLVRREQRRVCVSLDQVTPGSTSPWLDLIHDDLDLLSVLETEDLITRTLEAIATLDQRYPEKGYRTLWQGMVEGKDQSQIAIDLGVTQSAVSKRLKDLYRRVAEQLGLLRMEDIHHESAHLRQTTPPRTRSRSHW